MGRSAGRDLSAGTRRPMDVRPAGGATAASLHSQPHGSPMDGCASHSQPVIATPMTPPLSPNFLESVRQARQTKLEAISRARAENARDTNEGSADPSPEPPSGTADAAPQSRQITRASSTTRSPAAAPSLMRSPQHTPMARLSPRVRRAPYTFNWLRTHAELSALVEHCQAVIGRTCDPATPPADALRTTPTRISAGSSGSYHVRAADGTVVGIFKPRDEEPYAPHNPKWAKRAQRLLCPCLFGRPYLHPGGGYVSEAAASIVDAFLGLDVVPRTTVAFLSSPVFSYPLWQRVAAWQATLRDDDADPEDATGYPPKAGSFQLYVRGFLHSDEGVARLRRLQAEGTCPALADAFHAEFERMVVLDYVIRNTDRTMDNWLLHVSIDADGVNSLDSGVIPRRIGAASVAVGLGAAQTDTESPLSPSRSNHSAEDVRSNAGPPSVRPRVKIACIDNGLAFPTRHPRPREALCSGPASGGRASYAYAWQGLREVNMPFSAALRARLLPLLRTPSAWELLVARLRPVFMTEPEWDAAVFERQMGVVRGQMYNLVCALRAGESPAQLLMRAPLRVRGPDDPVFASGDAAF